MPENNYEPLGQDDVVQIPVGLIVNGSPRFMDTLTPFIESFKEAVRSWPYAPLVMHEKGYPITVLKTSGGGWQKGKLRIRVVIEFEPEQPPELGEHSHDH
jgi:hypothetical protein